MSDPKLNTVDGVSLCDLCLDGKGGECHTPGCLLYLLADLRRRALAAPPIAREEELVDFIAQIVVVTHNHQAWTSTKALHDICEQVLDVCRAAGVAKPIARDAIKETQA